MSPRCNKKIIDQRSGHGNVTSVANQPKDSNMQKNFTWKIIFSLIGIAIIALVVISFLSSSSKKPSTKHLSTPSTHQSHWWSLHKKIPWTLYVVKPGGSLNSVFKRANIPYDQLDKIMELGVVKAHLSRILPKQKIYIYQSKQHQLLKLKTQINNNQILLIERDNNKYLATLTSIPYTSKDAFKEITIHHSLLEAAKRNGIPKSMYQQLVTIFQGEINFSRQLRAGAKLAIVYKEYYLHGKKNHPGNILIAVLDNKGKVYRAIRFTYPRHHTGYYLPSGAGVKPLFTIPPLKYKFISSYFTYHRMDPILHKIRPHLGIDYAANYGTPIHSIGNGKVIFAGKDDGYGNAVIIRYSKKYKALYGHMEKFAKGLHVGERVKEGEVIGYVGSSGWSTGPHLHFELYVYGTPRDPLKMHFPKQKYIPRSYTKQFHETARKLMDELQAYEKKD